MAGRFVRSKIAELVAQTLGNRQSREILKNHGWAEGMPIVIARHDEKLHDVMALVSVHRPPALTASLDPISGELCFTYVAIGCTALEAVPPRNPQDTIQDLYVEAQRTPCLTFRIAQLTHSAIAHAVPPLSVDLGPKYQIATASSSASRR